MEIHLEGRLPKSPAAAIHLAGRSCNHLRRVRLRRDPTDMITTRSAPTIDAAQYDRAHCMQAARSGDARILNFLGLRERSARIHLNAKPCARRIHHGAVEL